MIKPMLVPTDKSNLIKSGFNTLWSNPTMKVKSSDSYVNIILIDTEAEIVEGDLVKYNCGIGTVLSINPEGEYVLDTEHETSKAYKIISSTNKSHKVSTSIGNKGTVKFDSIPQLSPQSIQLLINYYNEYKVMPESVNVPDELDCEDCHHKYDCNQLQCGLTYPDYCNSRGEVDITIPEIEEKSYTESYLVSNVEGSLDHFLLHSPSHSQEERELIMETLSEWLKSKR